MTPVQKSIKSFAIALAIVIICAIASSVIGILNFILREFIPENKPGEAGLYTYSNIDFLEIDLENATLELVVGNSFKIETSDDKYVSVTNHDKTVKVKEKNNFFWDDFGGNVKVYIPDEGINRLSIDVGAGKVSLDNSKAKYFELDQGAGIVTIKNSIFDKANIEGGAGKIDIDSTTLKNLSFNTGVGRTNITNSKILGRNEIVAGVGSVYIGIDESINNYSIEASKGIGSLKINGTEQEGEIGNGNNRLEIDGGVGDITVEFLKD